MTQELARESVIRERDPSEGIAIIRCPKAKDTGETIEPLMGLLAILSHRRPFDSRAEEEFAKQYIEATASARKLTCEVDEFRNRHIKIPNTDGSPSRVMWSCHIDTCHHDEGYQRLSIRKDQDGLFFAQSRNKEEGNCLGADDGTGVWLMLELIRAGKPGYYVFHRGEERGCLGSRWLVDKEPDRFAGKIDCAIALDRRDFDNIITHQGGERGCSDAFATFISKHLLTYRADPTGAFTDTKQYFRIIPECTNLSVGYQHQHGPMERQYLTFARKLRDALVTLPIEDAPTLRDPKKTEHRTYGSTYSSGGGYNHGTSWLDRANPSYDGGNGYRYGAGWLASRENPLPRVWSTTENCMLDRDKAIWDADKHSWASRRRTASILALPAPKNGADRAQNHLWSKMQEDAVLSLGDVVIKYPSAVARFLSSHAFTETDILEEVYGDQFIEFLCETDEDRLFEHEDAEEDDETDAEAIAASGLALPDPEDL